jgi:hypothetical protein
MARVQVLARVLAQFVDRAATAKIPTNYFQPR